MTTHSPTELKIALQACELVIELGDRTNNAQVREIASALLSLTRTMAAEFGGVTPSVTLSVTPSVSPTFVPSAVIGIETVGPATFPAKAEAQPTAVVGEVVAAAQQAKATASPMGFEAFSAKMKAVVGNPAMLSRLKDALIAFGAATIQEVDPTDRAAFLEEVGL